MKQTARIISTYSADVMGVCSALFELGGMTIMHDASGCNSTYTTHDEPRWYDMDSMVYISGISEMEAIMGDDEKLIGDIEDAASSLHPAFIAIAGTPIPTMTGFDFESVAEVIEHRTGIPCMGLPTTGMNTYIHGASMAFEELARRLVDDPETEDIARPLGNFSISGGEGSARMFEPCRVNVLGLTPLDFSVNGEDRAICDWLTGSGCEVNSRWAMGCSLDEIRRSSLADVNFVVSASGLGAAEVLYEKYGIPYIVGLPIGQDQKDMIIEAINELSFESRAVRHSEHPDERLGTRSIVIASDLADSADDLYGKSGSPEIVIIGEGITSLGLANAVEFETGRAAKILCTTECPSDILRECDRMTPDEDDIIPELEGAKIIIADPMYQPICPVSADFISLPSEAFSGRIYRDDIPDLVSHPEAILERLV